jgi:hypothetical protein
MFSPSGFQVPYPSNILMPTGMEIADTILVSQIPASVTTWASVNEDQVQISI